MDFAEVVRKRRMVRAYTDEPVDPAAVRRALEHAHRAPSAGFSQGWAFLLLDDAATVTRFWTATTPAGKGDDGWSRGMRTAPVIVVPLSCKRAYLDRYAEPDKGWTDRDEGRWGSPYWDIDTGMAALLMLLTAVDEGLGACFFGIPPDRIGRLRAEFGVPDDHHPIGAITLGHPAAAADQMRGSAGRGRGEGKGRGRRPLADVVHRGAW